MERKDIYAVLMAGGKGERFWPQSRTSTPKPLLRLVGELTLIELTIERIRPFVSPENILIITNREYIAPIQSLFSGIPHQNIIGEPVGRDTAPCLALAAAVIKARNPAGNPVMIVLPSDHVIKDNEVLASVLLECAEFASKGRIVTMGVAPTAPSTGYGYICCGNRLKEGTKTAYYEALQFKEKPDIETARKFLQEKNYRWNSGIFIWSVSTFASAMKRHCPDLSTAYDSFRGAAAKGGLPEALQEIYPRLPRISIDYAMMEKAENVIVAEWNHYWDDVGSWTALRNQIKASEGNNVIRGLHCGVGTSDCIVVGDANHLVATLDVKDLVIVHTDDVTMVCSAQSAQRVKELVRLMASKPDLAKFL